MIEWKDIKKNPPPIGVNNPVLVWDGEYQTVAHFSGLHLNCWVHNSYGFNEDGEILNVTHWKELDPNPTGE